MVVLVGDASPIADPVRELGIGPVTVVSSAAESRSPAVLPAPAAAHGPARNRCPPGTPAALGRRGSGRFPPQWALPVRCVAHCGDAVTYGLICLVDRHVARLASSPVARKRQRGRRLTGVGTAHRRVPVRGAGDPPSRRREGFVPGVNRGRAVLHGGCPVGDLPAPNPSANPVGEKEGKERRRFMAFTVRPASRGKHRRPTRASVPAPPSPGSPRSPPDRARRDRGGRPRAGRGPVRRRPPSSPRRLDMPGALAHTLDVAGRPRSTRRRGPRRRRRPRRSRSARPARTPPRRRGQAARTKAAASRRPRAPR